MNYRTMVKGALALSLSLIVGSSWAAQTTADDVQKYGATFEDTASAVADQKNDYAYVVDTPVTNYFALENGEKVSGWMSGSDEDESKIIAGGPDGSAQTLQLNTDAATLTNKFAAGVASDINDGIAAAGAFFETDVKFVASDTPEAGITGGTDATKFAIFAYCNEDAEPATTNLVVYHGVMGDLGITYTNEIFEGVTINTEAYTRLRVEMKKMVDPNDPLQTQYNVFSVKVGAGDPLSSDTAFDALIEEKPAGTWFLTTENTESDSDMEVASLNFKGTGEIDNISVGVIEQTTTYAIDWTGSDGVTVASAGNALVAGDTNFVAGAEIVFTATGENVTITNIFVDGVAQSITNDTVYGYTVGAADAVVTVLAGVAVQPLDDNWTIEGLNPRGEWTDPTAIAADSKTLFYSNIVVNIDPATEGRYKVAAWIGSRIVAPEAVTSANASQWTIGIGSATYTFDQVKEDEGNYFNLWVPITAADVRTAIATQSDIVYAVEAYTDPSAKQILSMVICPKNIQITNTGDVEGGETIEVNDWIENVVAPTVITVAKLSATSAMVDDAAPTITATVTDSNGDAVDAANYTIDASAIDMTTAGLYPVVITATGDLEGAVTNYFAVMSLTWFNGTPTQKALIAPQNANPRGAHYMHTTQDGAYLALNGSNGNGTGAGHFLYSVATLESIYGTCQGVWEVAHKTDGSNKGISANTTSGIMLIGGGTMGGTQPTQSSFKGYDISDLANIGNTSNLVEETYVAEWAGSGYTSGQVIDGLDFSHDGTKVYGNNAGTDGPWVYELAIDKNAKTMTWQATYTSDFARVRSVSAYYIDGKDYIFIGEGASSRGGGIAVIDPSDGSITKLCTAADDFTTAEFPSGKYFTNVKVSGIASGEMYLYGCTDSGEVVIWALGHDASTGEWKTAPVGNITGAQTAALNSKGSVGNCRAFEVADDNNAGFLYCQSAPGQFAVVTDISLAQRKALASATLTPAGSNKDVALGEITATVLDENGDTVAAAEYTITTNLIDIATVGEYTVTITPVEGSIYSNSVTAVYTISEASADAFAEGDTYGDVTLTAAQAEWLNAFDNYAAIDAALKTDSSNLEKRYLLNVDPLTGDGTLTLTAITVGNDVQVTIALARSEGETAVTGKAINGTLKLYGASDLTVGFGSEALGSVTFSNGTFATGDTATATFTGSGATFFKAVIE